MSKLSVDHALSYLMATRTEKDLVKKLRKKEGRIIKSKIVVNSHAVGRWNLRVGPYITQSELENLFHILNAAERIYWDPQGDFGVIDREIVFIFERKHNTMEIKTFYGRISENPVLQGYCDHRWIEEKVKLNLPEEILRTKKMPPIPETVYRVKGSRHTYVLEKFNTNDGSLFRVLKNGSEGLVSYLVDQSEPGKGYIDGTVLKLLWKMGFEKFVMQHRDSKRQKEAV